MAKLSQIQGIKLSQNIALTPQLIQAIKLFELNNIELEEYIDREIIDNPFLDKDDGSNEEDIDKNYNENILPENTSSTESEIHTSNQESPIDDQSNIFDNSYGGENPEINNYIEETVSFKQSSKEFLIEQVNIAFKNELDRQIAFLLIDNLEGSGFLKISLKDFSIDIGIDENKVFVVDFVMDPVKKEIILPKIEYDFAKWDLRAKSIADLDMLAEALKDNPNVVIELKSHTDYVGNDRSNQRLSQKRADACVEYLVSIGINPGQLVAVGVGEKEPFVIENKDGRFKQGDVLTESYIRKIRLKKNRQKAHQYNRRTSFKVLREDYVPSTEEN